MIQVSNYGAYVDGKRPATKAALKRAVANGSIVEFDETSAFSSGGTRPIDGLGPVDVIVGPDPYNSRKWYANVRKNSKGVWTVV